MGLRGIDISNHQSAMDVERVVRENDIEFVFILTNDGTFVNVHFHAQADAAERAGAIVLPYVYLRPNVAQTIDTHLSIVGDRYDASIVDVEEGSGGWNETWSAHNRLWAAGKRTPLVYFPNFYWQSVGSPDLTPLKDKVSGHWKSWYADRDWRDFDDAFSRVPGYVWNDSRGGIPTVIVQFTGTGRLSGYGGNLDLNYFPGTRGELAALLGSGNGNDDMTPDQEAKLDTALGLLEGLRSALAWPEENREDGKKVGHLVSEIADVTGSAYSEDRPVGSETDTVVKSDLGNKITQISRDVKAFRQGGVDANAIAAAVGAAVRDELAPLFELAKKLEA